MPRQTFDAKAGLPTYRTRLLTAMQAHTFMKCLKANHDRFTVVEFHHSEQAKGEKCCFVSYQPVSEDAVYAAAQREQDKRDAKAQTEGNFYLWDLEADHGKRFYRCCSLSGECYEVTAGSCTCPDWTYRLQGNNFGLHCKHMASLLAAYDACRLVPLHLVVTPSHRQGAAV